jgi:hypothetical protein
MGFSLLLKDKEFTNVFRLLKGSAFIEVLHSLRDVVDDRLLLNLVPVIQMYVLSLHNMFRREQALVVVVMFLMNNIVDWRRQNFGVVMMMLLDNNVLDRRRLDEVVVMNMRLHKLRRPHPDRCKSGSV